MLLESPDNPKIRYLSRLKENSSFRKRERKFILEGPAAIRTLLERKQHPLAIYWCPALLENPGTILKMAGESNVALIEITERCYRKISDVKTPQGIAALLPFLHYDAGEIFLRKKAAILCLTGIQDPGNLGTLIRTADAAGADALATIGASASFFNPKTVRASAGSIVSIPLLSMDQKSFFSLVAETGIHVYTASSHKGAPFRRIRFERPLCIVVGSESHGIPPEIEKIGRHVAIPMKRGVESLNAAVAGALLLYQAMGVG